MATKRHRYLPVLVVMLALLTGLSESRMSRDSLWHDEVFTMFYAGGVHDPAILPSQVMQNVLSQQSHEKNPPGYYLVLNRWAQLVGWSEFATQMLSVFAALLTVSLTYRLGSELARHTTVADGGAAGLGSAAALAGSAFFIHYAHELRAYALVAMFAVLIALLYVRLLRRPSLIVYFGFALSIAGALYTHYTSIIILMVIGMYHVALARGKHHWWRIAGSALAGGALFLPWLAVALDTFRQAGASLAPTAMNGAQVLLTLTRAFTTDNLALFALLIGVALLIRQRWTLPLWGVAVGSMVILLLLNAVYPMMTHIRYALLLWPLLALVIGLAVERLRRGGIPPLIPVAVLLGIGIFNTVDQSFIRSLHDYFNGTTMPWHAVRRELQNHATDADLMVFHSPIADGQQEIEMDYYVRDLAVQRTLTERIGGRQANDEYYRAALDRISGKRLIWLGVDTTRAPNFRLAEFERALRAEYVSCSTIMDEPEMTLSLYARRGAAISMWRSGYGIQPAAPLRLDSRHIVRALLVMTRDPKADAAQYSLGIYMMNAGGNVVIQHDEGLPTETHACRRFDFDLSAFPTGEYRLYTAIYDWRTGQRVPLLPNAAQPGDLLLLGTVQR